MLEGLDYLVNVLPFKKVLHFIEDMKDEVALRDANLIVVINPQTFKPREIRLLERELNKIKKKSI